MLASDIKESENNSVQEIRTGSGELDATSVKFDYSREDYLKKKDRIFEILQKMKKSNDGECPDEETSTESGSQRHAPKNYSSDIRLEPTWKTNKNPQLSSHGCWFQKKYTSNDSKSDSGSSISSTVSLVTKRGSEAELNINSSSTSSSTESELCSTTVSESLSPCYSGNATSSTVVDCSIDSLRSSESTKSSECASIEMQIDDLPPACADKIFPGEAKILAIRGELFANEWQHLTKLDTSHTLPPTSEHPDEKVLSEDSDPPVADSSPLPTDSVNSNSDALSNANSNALISSSDADSDPLAVESGTLIEDSPSPIDEFITEAYSSKNNSFGKSKSQLIKGSSISLPDLRRKLNPKLKISASFTSSGYSSFHSNCSEKELLKFLIEEGRARVSSNKCATITLLSNEIENGGSSGPNQSPNNCTEKDDTVEIALLANNSTEVADTHDEVMSVHEEEEIKEKRKGRKKKRQAFKKKLSSLWKFLTCGVGHSRSH